MQFQIVKREMQKNKKPGILMGDLNSDPDKIPDFDFNCDRNPDAFTCTNNLKLWMRGLPLLPDKKANERDDYILADGMTNLQIRLVETFNTKQPEEALSDHHALVATLT